jgi:hypothetical protein
MANADGKADWAQIDWTSTKDVAIAAVNFIRLLVADCIGGRASSEHDFYLPFREI